jgi:hypothetical protein
MTKDVKDFQSPQATRFGNLVGNDDRGRTALLRCNGHNCGQLAVAGSL